MLRLNVLAASSRQYGLTNITGEIAHGHADPVLLPEEQTAAKEQGSKTTPTN